MIKVKFLGAAGTVTGSKYLLQLGETNILVDCGLFQGLKFLRNLNWEPLATDISKIQAVVITHAHLDHTGYLPRLVKEGYKGKVWMTAPTAELTEIILKDSAKIQEEDAEQANRQKFSKHHPALPLYTTKPAEEAIKLFNGCEPDQWIEIAPEVKILFRRNGHILGSCFLLIEYKGKKILFSGDIGRNESVTLHNPNTPDEADVVFIESTYGNRLHPSQPAEEQLGEIINDAVHKKGNLLISSFAVGRAQELMVLIHRLKKANKIPRIPVYLDTPMGAEVTRVMFSYPKWHKLTFEECEAVLEETFFVKSVEDTLRVIEMPGPKLIIAASGMLTGGRILHYLKNYLEDPHNTVVLVGYQAEGTRGKTLKEKGHELKIHGQYYRVKAEVKELTTLSAHADQAGLIDWLKNLTNKPSKVFLVHGENDALFTFQVKIKDTLGLDSVIPVLNDEYEIIL